jgi:hypothetical protein
MDILKTWADLEHDWSSGFGEFDDFLDNIDFNANDGIITSSEVLRVVLIIS